jgi:hypothetical protein
MTPPISTSPATPSTRVRTTAVDRFGTFWWYDEDYRALERELHEAGVEVRYRHIPGLGTLLSSR